MAKLTIATVGNPNCGKTTLFNALTGSRQKVGNWPGVTVDRKEGTYQYRDAQVTIVDLPGTYSLGSASGAGADEVIARDYIVSGEPELIVNVIDASNLERNLYLTAQLIEMRVPVVVALNMMDVAKEHEIEIDTVALSNRLGCPVVPLIASKNQGIEDLKAAVAAYAADVRSGASQAQGTIPFGKDLDGAIAEIAREIGSLGLARKADTRWLAGRLIEGSGIPDWFSNAALAAKADAARTRVEEALDDDIDIAFADGLYQFANAAVGEAVRRPRRVSRTTSDKIDAIVLNRWIGIPIFLVVMYLLFLFSINFSAVFIDFFDILFQTVLVDWPTDFLSAWGAPGWLIALLPGGVGAGIQTVSTFVPVVGFLFLFLSILEDSGYMARAAFVMDRFMRLIGLPGKSFIPMIIGFGCNVPAIMATRTLDNRKDRIMTAMMTPFMSCGARLPVYALFAAAFFPTGGQNIVFLLYIIGIAFAILTGLVLKNTILKGTVSPFIMELPPYHIPTVMGVLRTTWDRLKAFLFRAGKVIVGVVVVIGFLNSFGPDGSFGNEDTDNSLLAAVGQEITPVFAPMGLEDDNWPAAVGILTGILAKEAVVGTLNSLYEGLADDANGEVAEDEAFDFWGGVSEAFATIPANLADMVGSFTDPLGLNVGDVEDQTVAADEQGVSVGTFQVMGQRFDGVIGAFAYLLAVLLYMPCGAAVAAIWRETGPRWAVFASAWTTGVAYGASVIFYQAGTFAQHQASSTAWIAVILIIFAGVLMTMRRLADRGLPQGALTSTAE